MGLAAVLGFLVYSPMLSADFVWDDGILVVKNSYIHDGSHLKEILTSDIAAGAGRNYYFYRPFQMISYTVDHALFGLDPWGYHAVNILMHIAVAWFVFLIAGHLAKNARLGLLAGVIFLLHPVHSSVVSYIASRADLLCGLGMLGSFYWYVRYAESGGNHRLLVAAIFYLCALFSKEYAVVLPLLLWLYHAAWKVPLRRPQWMTFAGMFLFYCWIRLAVVPHILSPSSYRVPLVSKIPGSFAALREYLRLLVFPVDLHMEYGNRLFSFRDAVTVQGIVMFVAIVLATVFFLRRKSLVGFACGWFLICLIPVTVFPLNAFMAENWLYLPSVGYAFILAWLLNLFWTVPTVNWGKLVAAGVVIFYSLVIGQQTAYWQNDLSLFSRTAQYAPWSGKTFYNLGNAYFVRGNKEKAAQCYQKAMTLNPDIIEAGSALQQL